MPPPKTPRRTYVWVVAIVGFLLGVPCCIGLASAVAIPQYVAYVSRSKTTEAESHLRSLYMAAESYYAREHVAPDGTALTNCTVASAMTPNAPGPERSVLDQVPVSFGALDASFVDPVYYQYEIVSVGGCGHPPNSDLYSFRAHGDLDGDGTQSLFEISAGSNGQNVLMRAPGIFRENELE